MKTLRSHGRATSPANNSTPSSSKPTPKVANFSKMRRSGKDGISNSSKKPRNTTTTASAIGDGPSTSSNGKVSNKNKKRSKFYNKTCVEKPTELFRTDLISNMTVADNEPLNNQADLITLKDTWRKEWNEGVQVPIYENEDFLEEESERAKEETPGTSSPAYARPPVPVFYEIEPDPFDELTSDFLARSRSLRSKDRPEDSSSESKIGNHLIQYELDDLDLRWLGLVNAKLYDVIAPRFTLTKDQLEKALERLEITFALRCADEQQSASFIRQQADSDAVCDICRGEFSEEGNLLVFCDRCNVCVHQACYGIRRVPLGPWVCRPCTQDLRPSCILCPNRGGAMKPTKSGTRWAHVSCAVWIPEVEFGNPSLKEPVTKIARIPEDRWTLQCEICEQRNGACIQCDIRNCHVSYHVTCAQRAGWKVTYKEAVPEDDPLNVLESYCKKHSKNWPPASADVNDPGEGTSADHQEPKRQPASAIVAYKLLITLSYPDLEHVFDRMNEIPTAFRRTIFYYWRTKRLAAPERSLIYDLDECQMTVERDREAEFLCRRVDSLISLRQTLEKTRTLCYMVERRERMKKQWIETAAKEFEALIGSQETPSGHQKMDTSGFLQTFALGYQFEKWKPKEKKMAELRRLIPPSPPPPVVPLKTPMILGTPRKRGRPPKSLLKSGTSSPLAVVNSPTPKRTYQKRKYRHYEGEEPKTPLIKKERKSDDQESNAQNSKRKRTPRVQYSPN